MADQKEKQRFIFFKYVPPKKGHKPLKDEEYSKKAEADVPQTEADTPQAEGFGPPNYGMPEPPDNGGCPEEPECPELPEPPGFPECPEAPEIPECPELPELPEVPEGPCPEDAVMHVIQAGDTFWKLAKKYGTSVEAIEAANPEIDPLNLQVGETICVPVGIPGAKG